MNTKAPSALLATVLSGTSLLANTPAPLLPPKVNRLAHCSRFNSFHLSPYNMLKVTVQVQAGQLCRDCHGERELPREVSQQSALLCLSTPAARFHKAITHTEKSTCNLPKPQIPGGVAFQKWQVSMNTQ